MGEFINPTLVGALIIRIHNPLEILPRTPSITDHVVIPPEFKEAEEIEGIKRKRLIVKTERQAIIAIEGMSPSELGVNHDRIRPLRTDALQQSNGPAVVTVESGSDCQPEPRVRSIDRIHEALINRHCVAVSLQADIELTEAFEYLAALMPFNRIAPIERREKLLVRVGRLAVVAESQTDAAQHTDVLRMPVAAVDRGLGRLKGPLRITCLQALLRPIEVVQRT